MSYLHDNICKTISNIFFLNAISMYAIHISISIQSDIFKLLEQEMYMQERIELRAPHYI